MLQLYQPNRLFTSSTNTEDVYGVAGGTETVSRCYLIGPLLNLRSLDFHGLATLAANEVMVMYGSTSAIQQFAVLALQDVGFVGEC